MAAGVLGLASHSPPRHCPLLTLPPLQDGLGREEYLGGGSSSPSDSSSPPTPSDTPTPSAAGQGGQQPAAHPAASQALPVQLTPGLVLASSVPGKCRALTLNSPCPSFIHSSHPRLPHPYLHPFTLTHPH